MSDQETELREHLLNDSRFLKDSQERYWHISIEEGKTIGTLYKYPLGGWRLVMNTDSGGEWKERGLIMNIDQLNSKLTYALKYSHRKWKN